MTIILSAVIGSVLGLLLFKAVLEPLILPVGLWFVDVKEEWDKNHRIE